MTLAIRVNGEERPLDAETLAELLPRVGIDRAARGIAIAINGTVVPRVAWPITHLSPNDAIEIVRPYRGG